jgi:hypothetical protein
MIEYGVAYWRLKDIGELERIAIRDIDNYSAV